MLVTYIRVVKTENKRLEMKNFSLKYLYTKDCPFRFVMNRIGDKWSVIILITLGENGSMRFGELDKSIEDISQKMLTTTLRALEKEGLISRTMHREIPPRVEYELTNLGKSLVPLIENLVEWSMQHVREIKDIGRYDKACFPHTEEEQP